MKVLYISPHTDGTGYANSAIQHMLALNAAGIDVVARSIKMTPGKFEILGEIKSFEQKDLKDVDVVIQHNLPSEFAYKGGVSNIGIFAYETSGFPHSDWKFGLQLMDKVIVSSTHQLEAVKNTCGPYFENKTFVIPHPVDINKFKQSYDPMDFECPRDTVKFYTISEFNKRKNLPSLLAAYYTAFDSYDNVLLIIKTNLGSGKNLKDFEGFCQGLKKSLGRFKNISMYPKVALINQHLKDEHICSLHQTGDIFVSASRGEAICLPLIDATGFGNPCVVPKHSSFLDYSCPSDSDLFVESNDSIAFGVDNAPDGLYTCDETWGNVSLVDLSKKMRWAYRNIEELKSSDRVTLRKKYVNKMFSYENVGGILKEVLDAKTS